MKAPIRTTLPNWDVMSAYPNGPVKVVDFKYKSDLHLFRRIEAVKGRRGGDANYIVSQGYKAIAIVRGINSETEEEFPIWVPRCLLTDLASVPWFARWCIGRVGPHLEACIIHDWLYVAWQVEGREPMDVMRTFADDIFREAMKKAGVNSIKIHVIYIAVRSFGRNWFMKPSYRLFDEPSLENVEP